MLVGKRQMRVEKERVYNVATERFTLKTKRYDPWKGGVKEASSRIILDTILRGGIFLAAGFCMVSIGHPVPRLVPSRWIHCRLAYAAQELVWATMRGRLGFLTDQEKDYPWTLTGHP